uniref:Uncharacterized protein n=1 Tax=Pseudomonas phage Cygsa01 TaxID=3138529 RepID=A0AAU6W3F3_9VIRU
MGQVKNLVAVDALAMQTVLSALYGPAHHIRELQACASLPDSPLALLLDQYNAQAQDAGALALQTQLMTFYSTDSLSTLIKMLSDDVKMLQDRLRPHLEQPASLRPPREG